MDSSSCTPEVGNVWKRLLGTTRLLLSVLLEILLLLEIRYYSN